VRVWDVTTGAQLAVLSGHDNTVFSAVFSPGGDEIVSASQDGTARIWSAKNLSGPTIFCCHFGAVNTARFSPQGDAIVSASNDGSAYILNASDLSSRHRIVLEQPKKIGSVRQPLNSAAFSSHDGKYVVTASLDGHIDVFFRNNGKLSYDTALPQDISFPDHTAYSAIYSPDNRFIAAASADRNVYILDASNGNVVRTLHHQDIVYSAVFSGDTRLIVTTSKDKVTRVWEVSSGKLLAELKGRNRIRWAEFSPEDSKYIVTACDDRFAYLWDWRAKKWIKRFGPHNDLVARASFYWDATAKKLNILTASKDGTVRLWDRDTAEPLKVISIPAGQINFADVPRFGGEVVAAADDGTIRIWSTNNELSLAQELDWAQAASFLLPNNAFRGLGSEQPKPMASSIRTPDQKKRPDLEKAEELKIGMIFAHYQSDLARGPQGRGDARLDEAKLLEEFQKCAKQVVAQTADPAWKTGDPLWRNDMAMLAMRLSVHGKRKQVAEAFEKIEHH
jgi:WD40 repeat protein